MTSLDQQLRKLAVHSTQALLGDQRQRPSLLFEKSEAATIGNDELHSIGVNGILELGNVDRSFYEYENSLFSEASRSFERMQQSKDANEALDRTIGDFLIKLSPYFQLRAATKALEWLIYKYRIHLTNVDDLMYAIMPYYATAEFVKVIQTFRLDQKNGRWYWLKPMQESGVPIARSVLLKQCVKDPNFLQFMCTIVSRHTEVLEVDSSLKNVFCFFTSIIVGALQLGKIKETTIAALLPVLLPGFKSKIADYKASVLVITSQITSVVKLEQSMLQKLVAAMTKHPEFLATEILMSLVLICQTQDIDQLQKRTFKHLCRTPGLVQHLENLTTEFNAERLLKLFFSRLVPHAIKDSCSLASSSEADDSDHGSRPQYLSLLDRILHGFRMEKTVAFHVSTLVAEQYGSMKGRSVFEPVLEKLREIFATLEKKYPEAVDELAKKDGDLVEELLSSTNQGMILNLNHASSDRRRVAVENLSSWVAEDAEDNASVARAILARLEDDDKTVVTAVLNLNNLYELVSTKDLLSQKLIDVLDSRYDMVEWEEVTTLVVKHLVGCWSECSSAIHWQVYLRMLPYLLCGADKRHAAIQQLILKSRMASKDNVLKGLSKSTSVGSAFCSKLTKQPAEYLQNLVETLLEAVARKAHKHIYVPVAMRLLCAVIPETNDPNGKLRYSRNLLDIIVDQMDHLDSDIPLKASGSDSIFAALSEPQLLLRCLSTVIVNLECPSTFQQELKWWNMDKEDDERLFVRLSLDVLNLITSYMSVKTKKTIVKEICQQASVAIKNSCMSSPIIYFNLVTVLFNSSCDLGEDAVYKLRSLHYARIALSNTAPEKVNALLGSKSPIFPCLLVALSSEYTQVREAACDLMKELVKSGKDPQPYQVLCKHLAKVSDELTLSSEYVTEAMSAIYSDEKPASPKKGRRKSGIDDIQYLNEALFCLVDLVQYVDCTFSVKDALLSILILHEDVLMRMLPLLNGLLKKTITDTLNEKETRCLHLLVRRFTPESVQIFNKSDMAKELFFTCLSSTKGQHEQYITIQKLGLKQITKAFYEALPSEVLRQELLAKCFDLWVDNEDPELNKTFNKKIRSLKLDVVHLSQELRKLLPDTGETVKDTKRLRRRSLEPQSDQQKDNIFDTRPWKRTILVLEIIQNKKKIENIEKLTQDLFALLKLVIQQENQSAADYFKQLLLTCLLVIYHSLADSGHDAQYLKAQGAEFNVELVIQCIRTSENSQTYHHALMLLSKAVLLEPDRVLHNVMSIFTFMGANIVRQDDSYSFKVLTDTIDTLIPALMKANEDVEPAVKNPNEFLTLLNIASPLAHTVKHILQVFADAYPHMPVHRRLPLFQKLLADLNADKFLWMFLVLMIDSHTVKHKESQDAGDQTVQDFCLCVCDTFSVLARIGTAYKTLKYINIELKDSEKKDDQVISSKSKAKDFVSHAVIDFSHYKLKDAKMLKYALIGLVAQLLPRTLKQEYDTKGGKKLVKLYEKTMEECLVLIAYIGRAMSQETNNYWQALLTGAYRILDELQSLLEHEAFVQVVLGLIENELPVIRRKTMELVVNKLSTPRFSCKPEQVKAYMPLIPKLARAARTSAPVGDLSNNIYIANRQTSLLALRAMCRSFGPQNTNEFKQLLPLVNKLIGDVSAPVGVVSSAVVLLAELVTCLRAHAVSALGSFMPDMIRILERHRQPREGVTNDTLLHNTISAIQKIVEVLHNFISPYLFQLLSNIFWISSRFNNDEGQKLQLSQRLVNVRTHLSKNIPSRIFLPNLTKCYKELNEASEWRAVQPIMITLSEHISMMASEDVSNYSATIMTLFLTALEFRVEHGELELEQVAAVEKDVNEALASLVMKLSEATFTPLFYRLYDWAIDAHANKERLLTFYRLCDCLAAKMKNLFTKFASHILPNIAHLLDSNNSLKSDEAFFPDPKNTEKSTILITTILDVLYKCFLYDNEGFVTKDRFDTLMPPLVLQLENMQGGVEVYRERVTDHLVQTLVHLAVAAGDDGSWKPLNYQVCLKTRHSSATVRYAALSVIESLHDKLGTDYMSLLPETIQFLAELAEDENLEVENKCKDVIQAMEKTLGEPLSKYL